MRKSVVSVLLMAVMIVAGVSAGTYEEYLEKARDYESKQMWCNALDSYYDAMAVDLAYEDKKEAVESYKSLVESIKEGNPGRYEVSKAEKSDIWLKLAQETDVYAYTCSPFSIEIGKVREGAGGAAEGTVNLTAPLIIMHSDRYEKTVGVITKQSSMLNGMVYDSWPEHSSFREYAMMSGGRPEAPVMIICIDYYSPDYDEHFAEFTNTYLDSWHWQYAFKIVDKEGNELALSEKVSLSLEQMPVLTFRNVPVGVVSMLKEGKATVEAAEVSVLTGTLVLNETIRGSVISDNRTYFPVPLTNMVVTGSYTSPDSKKENVQRLFADLERETNAWIIPEIEAMMVPQEKTHSLWMKTEVTQALFESVTGRNPSTYKLSDNNPVETVSWYDAIYFCNRLSSMCGLTPCYYSNGNNNCLEWDYRLCDSDTIENLTFKKENDGFRLPTKEEWSSAADNPKGDWYSGSNIVNYVAWYKENSEGFIHEVAQKMENSIGLFDMSGNVAEWCYDTEASGSKVKAYAAGGSIFSKAPDCYTSASKLYDALYGNYGVGFRVVRNGESQVK